MFTKLTIVPFCCSYSLFNIAFSCQSYGGIATSTSHDSYIRMGYQASGDLELYMDDLVIWYKRLTSADVKFTYKRSKTIIDYSLSEWV